MCFYVLSNQLSQNRARLPVTITVQAASQCTLSGVCGRMKAVSVTFHRYGHATRCTLQQEPCAPTVPTISETMALPRRTLLAGTAAALLLTPAVAAQPAQADTILQDATRKVLRPDVDVDQAIVSLLNARTVLTEIKALAETPIDSDERFRTRSRIPTYAKYLREVGPATPIVASLVTGDKESSLTEEYGGKGASGKSIAVPIYESVGQILSLSGRGIKPEALESGDVAAAAIQRIDALLAQLPAEVLQQVQQKRGGS